MFILYSFQLIVFKKLSFTNKVYQQKWIDRKGHVKYKKTGKFSFSFLMKVCVAWDLFYLLIILSGVTQGSNLYPLSFIIVCNDVILNMNVKYLYMPMT